MPTPTQAAPSADDLIAAAPYTLDSAAKQRLFVPLLAEAFRRNAATVPAFADFLRKNRFDPDGARSVEDFPPLPVAVFKHFTLRSCAESEVIRELHSSGTTGQSPSRIFLDKTTLHRQRRALISILQHYLGTRRRPYLVFDVPEAVATEGPLTARGAAIRGLENFASHTTYALRLVGGQPRLDWPAVESFVEKFGPGKVLAFGFTFLVWSAVLPQLEEASKVPLGLSQATFFHGGGWKKLKEQAVSKETFTQRTARSVGCDPGNILEFYGMVEQVGSIFIDCEAGCKHPPNFATVIIRDPLTFRPCGPDEEGLIEVVSLLPGSYPGQVLLTEDQGILKVVDNCPCGRKDVAFQFTARVEQAETRGCGDVLAQRLTTP